MSIKFSFHNTAGSGQREPPGLVLEVGGTGKLESPTSKFQVGGTSTLQAAMPGKYPPLQSSKKGGLQLSFQFQLKSPHFKHKS